MPQSTSKTDLILIYSIKDNKWYKSKVVLETKLWGLNILLSYDKKFIHCIGGTNENDNMLSTHYIISLKSIFDGMGIENEKDEVNNYQNMQISAI